MNENAGSAYSLADAIAFLVKWRWLIVVPVAAIAAIVFACLVMLPPESLSFAYSKALRSGFTIAAPTYDGMVETTFGADPLRLLEAVTASRKGIEAIADKRTDWTAEERDGVKSLISSIGYSVAFDEAKRTATFTSKSYWKALPKGTLERAFEVISETYGTRLTDKARITLENIGMPLEKGGVSDEWRDAFSMRFGGGQLLVIESILSGGRGSLLLVSSYENRVSIDDKRLFFALAAAFGAFGLLTLVALTLDYFRTAGRLERIAAAFKATRKKKPE